MKHETETILCGLDHSWFDDERGSVDDGVWEALIVGPVDPDDLASGGDEIEDEDDRETIANCAALIVSRDSNGFCYVSVYESEDEARKDWDDTDK